MKRKAILMSKLQGRDRRRQRESIGLLGVRHGTGVTYTGLILAFFMGEECGKKTAFIECNSHHDMELIRQSYDWNENDYGFSFRNITCFKDVNPDKIPRILGEDFDCVIIDFGIDLNQNLSEFLRCNHKIVLSGNSQWDVNKLTQFILKSKAYRGNESWLYFIPQANNHTIINIRKETNRSIWAVPTIKNPINNDSSSIQFFRKFF